MNPNLKLLVFATLIIFGIAFYWYEIRPSSIRKKCAEKVTTEGMALTGEAERERLGWDMNKINSIEREKGEYWYRDCLHENGLEK